MELTTDNWRILIVEDDERLASLTRDYLQNNGLTVFNESHGAAAIQRTDTDANRQNRRHGPDTGPGNGCR